MADGAKAAALLSRIEADLEEYLALGEGTPLAGPAQDWLQQVKAARSETQAAGSEETPESEGAQSPPADFRGATKAAYNAMQNGTLSGPGGTKTEQEQSQDGEAEEEKRKRAKA